MFKKNPKNIDMIAILQSLLLRIAGSASTPACVKQELVGAGYLVRTQHVLVGLRVTLGMEE